MNAAQRITIQGIVQGVGFRPFVWRTAHDFGITGTVRNSPDGVTIHAEGPAASLDGFIHHLSRHHPPLAKIISLKHDDVPLQNTREFTIEKSDTTGLFATHVSPDITICEDCRHELFDPHNRRFRYPFINCTNCGPRFSIITDIPYDRPSTSMAGFTLCEQCAAEYSSPADRRYHAQPVACRDCGPAVSVQRPDGVSLDIPWEEAWHQAVMRGDIVAVKGIGGFHCACNALDPRATGTLRTRKKRERKPFAIMTDNMVWIKEVCMVSDYEEQLLRSPECPVVILKIKNRFPALEFIAPGLDTVGIMIPYSPMHLLMLDTIDVPVVMTSANYSNEPMIHRNNDALRRLAPIADLFIMHNREIVNRCDDSVALCPTTEPLIIRPGRGYAPYSFSTDSNRQVLAFGADMKNTCAFSHNGNITVSPYIGDLEHPATQNILLSTIEQCVRFYRLSPELIIHDSHPDYFSTQLALAYAQEKGIRIMAVQHHHAHVAGAYAENNLSGKAIGIALDGTGYGTDGTIWGGEVFLFDLKTCSREFHFTPVPLPGGDKAAKDPQRMLIAYLHTMGLLDTYTSPLPQVSEIVSAIDAQLNCPLTSSVGRLFDAVACMCGFENRQSYDGEAAMWLEALAAENETTAFPFSLTNGQIDCFQIFETMLSEKKQGTSSAVLAGRFHNTMVEILATCIRTLVTRLGDLPVVCAGGVFQNRLLVKKMASNESLRPYRIYFSTCPNDSGIAAGQAAVGLNKMISE